MKKIKTEKKELIYSEYQKNIFDYINHNVGNLVIEAAAGSGKTSTLLEIIKFIPINKKILFCAFNSDIVKEIKKKVKKIGIFDNLDIRTVHSLGYVMLLKNLHKEYIQIDENKYYNYLLNNKEALSDGIFPSLKEYEQNNYIDNINKLVNFARYNLAETDKDFKKIIEHHNISIIDNEFSVVKKILNWGRQELNIIDYTDMIWLPNILYLKPYGMQYDFILGDEAQDFSVAQRELILKCQKMGTRLIFCGDKSQCIYSFASASPESFDRLRQLPNTTTLPLSISYRCDKNIVKLAQNIVKSIEYDESKDDGKIVDNVELQSVNDGDMILSRSNAPLMKIYGELIKLNKKCFIKGKDIGLNLKKIVKNTKHEILNKDLEQDGVFSRLYLDLFNAIYKLKGDDILIDSSTINNSLINYKLDTIQALEYLADDLRTTDELLKKIDLIFSDRKKEKGIILSTIHKAKGLEADNVYIVSESLKDNCIFEQDWEKEQEKNLKYVAYTRAKHILGFLKLDSIKNITNNNILKKINSNKNKIEKLYLNDNISFQQKKKLSNNILFNNDNDIFLTKKSNEKTLININNKIKKSRIR